MRQISLIMLLMLSVSLVFSQNVKRVSGKIVFPDSTPAKGVPVLLLGSVNFTYSSMKDGSFRLNLDSNEGTILVLHEDFEINRIQVKSNTTEMKIVLTKKFVKQISVSNDTLYDINSDRSEVDKLIRFKKLDEPVIKDYGTLKGKVLDDKGIGLRGASVAVEGILKGAAVRQTDGSYIIAGIPVGEYNVRYSYTGFQTIVHKTRICRNETTMIDVTIKNSAFKSKEIIVIDNTDDKISVSKIGSADKKSKDEIMNTAREGMGNIIALDAGVINSGTGFSIRGGRDSETDVRIDHTDIGSTFTGGMGVTDAEYKPMVSSYAVEDIQVIKGGYSTEIAIAESNQNYSGLLTAGEVNDFSKWVMWNDITKSNLLNYKELWKMYPKERYTLQLENEFHLPVYGANISLIENEYVIWTSKTDNTGKAELWRNPFTDRKKYSGELIIEIEYAGKNYYIKSPKQFSDGINFFSLKTGMLKPQSVDIAFVVDATGSMSDEIDYLKSDILNVMKEIKDTLPGMNINLGTVFYRDYNESYITKYSDINSDLNIISKFINENEAEGGGDFPEAVERGLDIAINKLSWGENSTAKIIFLVLDAPPHSTPEIIKNLQSLTLKASEKGIRIIPVSCSGVDKSTEYFLRNLALLTNGTYTFLTDDSKIGNPHIKPTTDKYEVETLKDILIRLVYQYAYYPEIIEKDETQNEIIPDIEIQKETAIEITSKKEDTELESFKYYPNPTYGPINIELIGKAEELFISDISGKIVYRINPSGQNTLAVNMTEYPNGMYFIMYQYDADKWMKGKFILTH